MNSKPKITISQSLIKALDVHAGKCPAKAYAVFILGLEHGSSRAMELGNYFETVVYGATEDGSKIEPERNKKTNEILTPFRRVHKQAYRFMTEYAQNYKMDLSEPRVHLTAEIAGYPGYALRGRLDLVSSIYDDKNYPESPFIKKAIIDTKITGSITNTFGDFAWGNPSAMDHLQMDIYSMLYEIVNKQKVPCYYFVMDTSKEEGHLLVHKEVNQDDIRKAKKRIVLTISRIEDYFGNYGSEWPKAPNPKNCRGCPLSSTCTSAKLD